MSPFGSRFLGNCLVAYAPAKVNLTLRVTGRRADGYHELRSLVVTIDLVDTLVLSPGSAGTIDLRVNVPELNRDDNLVVTALRMVAQRLSPDRSDAGVRVYLHKRIPHGAGLGGGSSDGSCALRAGRDWFAVRMNDGELYELSAQLGSDCPFFVERRKAALLMGRGERLMPVRLDTRLDFVIVWPRVPVSTAEVFRRCQPVKSEETTEERLLALLNDGVRDLRLQSLLKNDLLDPAVSLCPAIGEALDALRGMGIPATMSGSGSAVVGIAQDRESAVAIARRLRQQLPHFVTVARSLE